MAKLVAQLHLETAIKQGLRCQAGLEFQSTAQEILRQRLPGFKAVLPHGRDGDGGNDGYSPQLGIYAQIYAPATSRMLGREAARKAVDDFKKITRNWSQNAAVKEYWFITNSSGSNIHIENALVKIEKQHRVKVRFLGSSELADEVLKLTPDKIEELLGLTVHDFRLEASTSNKLNLLASVSSSQLDALHLLASIGYPIPQKMCEGLFSEVTDWKVFWPWLSAGPRIKRGRVI